MLEIRGITRTYANGVRALGGVDLAIPRGLFGLLGPNGAGKSSLMRTIATLQAPDAGTITLDGRSIFADPTAYRRHLGYLPQDFGVYPGVSAFDLLDHREEGMKADDAEEIRVAYVAATRARDLLVVPAVGDEQVEGWVDVLHDALYPRTEDRQRPERAPGCPKFGGDTIGDFSGAARAYTQRIRTRLAPRSV